MGPKNALSGDKNHDIFHPDIIIYDIFLMILTWANAGMSSAVTICNEI